MLEIQTLLFHTADKNIQVILQFIRHFLIFKKAISILMHQYEFELDFLKFKV